MCYSECVLSKGLGAGLFGMVCSRGGFRGNVSSWFGRCFAGFLVMTFVGPRRCLLCHYIPFGEVCDGGSPGRAT